MISDWARQLSTQPQVPPGGADRARLVYSASELLVRARFDASSGVSFFTSPTTTTCILTSFTVHNVDATQHTFTLRLVPQGGTITDQTWDWYTATVPANSTPGNFPQVMERSLEEVLPPGYQIVGFADAAGCLNFKVNGLILTQQ